MKSKKYQMIYLIIFLKGLLASGGVDISSDVYAWVIVLVLPINSALNPFIYTFSMIYRQVKGLKLILRDIVTKSNLRRFSDWLS